MQKRNLPTRQNTGRLALGSYPDVGTKDARKARDAAKLQKSAGIDPVQMRKVAKLKAALCSGDTLEAAANDWLVRGKPNWSDTHYVREQRNITKDLLPYLGKRAIASIKLIELLAVIQKVEARGALASATKPCGCAQRCVQTLPAGAERSRQAAHRAGV